MKQPLNPMDIHTPVLERPPWLRRMHDEGIDMSLDNFSLSTVDAICAQLPIFGGTSTETEENKTATTTTIETKPIAPAGGEPSAPDPLAELQADPKKIQGLLEQVNQLNSSLSEVTKKNKEYETEKEKAARATASKEENLQKDLEIAHATIERMQQVISHTALTNAILSNNDFQWHSVRQMMAELQENEYHIDVDLEGGKATVSGIDNAVKRIARDCPWLLKSTAGPTNGFTGKPGQGRPSGTPPAGPRGNEGKTAKRADLINRFSALPRS